MYKVVIAVVVVIILYVLFRKKQETPAAVEQPKASTTIFSSDISFIPSSKLNNPILNTAVKNRDTSNAFMISNTANNPFSINFGSCISKCGGGSASNECINWCLDHSEYRPAPRPTFEVNTAYANNTFKRTFANK